MNVFSAKQHLNFSVYTLLLIFIYPLLQKIDIYIHFNLYLLLGVLTGSLLPDIDHKHSIAGSLIPAWLFTKHMGITHTILAIITIGGVFVYTKHSFVLGILIGYSSHIYIDHIDGTPLPNLFFPFKSKIPRYKTRKYGNKKSNKKRNKAS